MPDADEAKHCPLIDRPCIQNECQWWVKIVGQNQNTGERYDHWGCSWTHHPILQIENSAFTREVAAELATMRSEMWISFETILKAFGHDGLSILSEIKRRRDHVRSLNRTEELLRERAGDHVPAPDHDDRGAPSRPNHQRLADPGGDAEPH